jgi:hypothetical protein
VDATLFKSLPLITLWQYSSFVDCPMTGTKVRSLHFSLSCPGSFSRTKTIKRAVVVHLKPWSQDGTYTLGSKSFLVALSQTKVHTHTHEGEPTKGTESPDIILFNKGALMRSTDIARGASFVTLLNMFLIGTPPVLSRKSTLDWSPGNVPSSNTVVFTVTAWLTTI